MGTEAGAVTSPLQEYHERPSAYSSVTGKMKLSMG